MVDDGQVDRWVDEWVGKWGQRRCGERVHSVGWISGWVGRIERKWVSGGYRYREKVDSFG